MRTGVLSMGLTDCCLAAKAALERASWRIRGSSLECIFTITNWGHRCLECENHSFYPNTFVLSLFQFSYHSNEALQAYLSGPLRLAFQGCATLTFRISAQVNSPGGRRARARVSCVLLSVGHKLRGPRRPAEDELASICGTKNTRRNADGRKASRSFGVKVRNSVPLRHALHLHPHEHLMHRMLQHSVCTSGEKMQTVRHYNGRFFFQGHLK